MTNDNNILYLDNPHNNMKLTLEELQEWISKGRVKTLAVVACLEKETPEEDDVIVDGYVIQDGVSPYMLIGAIDAAKARVLGENIQGIYTEHDDE